MSGKTVAVNNLLLLQYLAVTPKNVTEFLSKALNAVLPTEYLTRQLTHQAEISELIVSCSDGEPRVPVFVCTTAYPSIHCPLFIYEPRYRLMVRRCVEAGTRQFGIAACFTTETGTRRLATQENSSVNLGNIQAMKLFQLSYQD